MLLPKLFPHASIVTQLFPVGNFKKKHLLESMHRIFQLKLIVNTFCLFPSLPKID